MIFYCFFSFVLLLFFLSFLLQAYKYFPSSSTCSVSRLRNKPYFQNSTNAHWRSKGSGIRLIGRPLLRRWMLTGGFAWWGFDQWRFHTFFPLILSYNKIVWLVFSVLGYLFMRAIVSLIALCLLWAFDDLVRKVSRY